MPEKEQEIQQKLVFYQILSQRLEQLNQQAKLIEQRMIELETTRQALEDLGRLKEDNDVLIPLGSGCYTYGKTGDSRKLLCELGAGVMLNKSPAEAKKIIEDKRAEAEKLSDGLQKEADNIMGKMNQIGPELQRFIQQSQEGESQKSEDSESAG